MSIKIAHCLNEGWNVVNTILYTFSAKKTTLAKHLTSVVFFDSILKVKKVFKFSSYQGTLCVLTDRKVFLIHLLIGPLDYSFSFLTLF